MAFRRKREWSLAALNNLEQRHRLTPGVPSEPHAAMVLWFVARWKRHPIAP